MILGVDIGTQSLKAVLLDSRFRVIGQGSRHYQPSLPRPGWVEQDPNLWIAALGPAIADALAEARAAPDDVKALGLCGQLDGCIAVDREGKALSLCLTWMDRRASREVSDIPPALIGSKCGLVLDPSHLGAKARWIKRHLETRKKIARFHQPVSFMVETLTGNAVIDHALASTSMIYSLDRGNYDDDLLNRFEIEARELPAIAKAEALAGGLSQHGASLTGLRVGTAVAVGTGDDFATPLGAGLHEPGRVAVVLGTGEVVGALHPTALRDERGLVETHAYPGGAFFIENPGWSSGGAITWMTTLLGTRDLSLLNELAAIVPAGCDGLTFLPALSGAMAPEWQPEARGCFYGLTPGHERGHLFRAVMEGCAFAMRDVIDRLGQMKIATDSILLLGGGARSALWAAMRADITQRPVEVPDNLDSAPIGAALLAAIAGNYAADLGEAMRLLPRQAKTIPPNPRNAETYEKAYRDYLKLFYALKPLFNDSGASLAAK